MDAGATAPHVPPSLTRHVWTCLTDAPRVGDAGSRPLGTRTRGWRSLPVSFTDVRVHVRHGPNGTLPCRALIARDTPRRRHTGSTPMRLRHTQVPGSQTRPESGYGPNGTLPCPVSCEPTSPAVIASRNATQTRPRRHREKKRGGTCLRQAVHTGVARQRHASGCGDRRVGRGRHARTHARWVARGASHRADVPQSLIRHATWACDENETDMPCHLGRGAERGTVTGTPVGVFPG